MEKKPRKKSRNKSAKPKKKKPAEGPTCSMFLADLRRRFQAKKRHDDEKAESKNIVKMIVDSISNALPVKFSRSPPLKKGSPIHIETLQAYAPELQPQDARILGIPNPAFNSKLNCVKAPPPAPLVEQNHDIEMLPPTIDIEISKRTFQMPRMPLLGSEIFKKGTEVSKKGTERTKPLNTEDACVNTAYGCDVAGELTKHVTTLKKISLIAEEFNQKTAKNLKEIVASVQEDLLKKLEEYKQEERVLRSTTKSLHNVTVADEK